MGDFSREFVEKISKAQDEPRWMRERRLGAYDVYEQLPTPKTPNEDTWKRTTPMRVQDYWRRTDLRTLKLTEFHPFALSPSDATEHAPLADLLKTPVGSQIEGDETPSSGENISGLIVQQDGVAVHASLSEELKRKGVYFAGLNTALRERPDLVEAYFMTRAVTVSWNKFDALHGAFWQGGYLLYVPKGVVVETPLRVFTALSEAQNADFSHALIIADADSQTTILEEHLSTNAEAKGLHCGAVEIFAERNAHVNYIQVQNWNHHVWNFSTQRAIVGADAQFRWVTGVLGGRVSKMHQLSVLEGAGSRVEMLGLTFTHGRQHIDIHTYQEHIAHHTTSDLLYRTALKERSRAVWNGMIYVHPEGKHTDAYQKNDNLLLSDHARADTNPGLEILASEGIRCTHGATAGPIDQSQVFYLMSRGLSYDQAERMIVDGFFEPVMQRIPLEPVKAQLYQAINRKLAI
jgi:Fe-S cluster assembly protein SufD